VAQGVLLDLRVTLGSWKREASEPDDRKRSRFRFEED